MPALAFSRHPHRAPRAEWLRVLAGYLVAIFLLQGMAAAVQLGAGPLHRHREAPVTLATLLFAHHDHAHASGERHQHEAVDQSVVVIAEAGPSDSVTSALCSALTLLAIGMAAPWAALAQRGRHVQRAALPWARHATPRQPKSCIGLPGWPELHFFCCSPAMLAFGRTAPLGTDPS